MKLKCVIVDDEAMARDFLSRYCQKNGSLEVVGSFADSSAALTYLSANEIDLLFLDVEMPGDTGSSLW